MPVSVADMSQVAFMVASKARARARLQAFDSDDEEAVPSAPAGQPKELQVALSGVPLARADFLSWSLDAPSLAN